MLLKINKKITILSVLTILFSLGIQNSWGAEDEYSRAELDYTLAKDYLVVKNVDGDTVKVKNINGGKPFYVRFMGVDTPETVKPNTPVQCYGREASDFTKSKIPKGNIIIKIEPALNKYSNRPLYDKYGRLLGYIWYQTVETFKNGTENSHIKYRLLQDDLLFNGYAREYTYKHNAYKYQTSFKNLENIAKEEHKGLWGKC